MPTLNNAKQELFAQNCAIGMGVNDAYISAGYSGTPQAANVLSKKPHVVARIAELQSRRIKIEEKTLEKSIERTARVREKIIERSLVTREWVLDHLVLNVQRAMQIIPPTKDGGLFRYEGSVANKALELLGKEVGMFVDRKEVGAPGEFAELDAEGLKQAIAERLTMVRQSDGSFGVPREEGSGGNQSD